MKKILLIEDDEACAYAIQGGLELLGDYTIATATNGKEGWDLYLSFCPDVVVSDVEMPLMDGVSLAKKIRNHNPSVILILESGRTAPKDVVKGFSAGIDAYIKKPFIAEELHAQIQAIMRRKHDETATQKNKPSDDGMLSIGNYKFNKSARFLLFNNERKIKLTEREAGILYMLYEHKNTLVPRKEILTAFWGDTDYFNSRSLDVFISKLRKYLSKDTSIKIVNERGKGLKLKV